MGIVGLCGFLNPTTLSCRSPILKLVSRGLFNWMKRGEKKEEVQRSKPMGRSPSSSKEEPINRGAWSAQEDKVLVDYITTHGEGRWRSVPKKAGLNRCGRSCRLRWLNYLRPNIKRGNISADEEDLIIRLHRLLGNRWSLIAGRLPGRTDNEIKNYWNTKLSKKLQQVPNTPSIQRNDRNPIKPQNPSENVRENGTGLMSPLPLQSKAPPLTEGGSVEVSAPKERHDEATGQNHGCPPPESHREDEDGRKSEKEFMDVISGEQSCLLSDPLDSRLFWGPDKEEEDANNEGRREVDGDGVRGYVSVTVNEGSRFGWAAATNELTWDEDLAGLGLDSDMAVFLDNGYGYWDSALGWI